MNELKDIFEKLKKENLELKDYLNQQMNYSGLLLKAISDICNKETINDIISRHFELMKEYDTTNER